MANIGELYTRCNDSSLPPEVKELACKELREQLRDLLQSIYLASTIWPRIPPFPWPDPILRDPTITPMIEQLANHQFLIGQLVLNELADPSPQPSIFSFIQDNELHLDAAKQLLAQFDQATDQMRELIEDLIGGN